MIVDVVMPKLGESITEGTIIQWQKKVGETIKKDEILLEIGTDKVDSEIPSPAAGVIAEILSNPNDVIPVEQVIARIDTEAEVGVEAPPVKEAPAKPKEEAEAVPVPPAPTVEPISVISPTLKTRSFYTPLVRSIAKREGISEEELATIPGTGKGSRVTKKDILAYMERRSVESKVEVPPVEAPEARRLFLGEETIEMDRIRQLIAEHMRKSLDTAAHVHLMSECDMTKIADFIKAREADFENQEGFKLTYSPFFILAAVKTIQDFPLFNTSLDGTTIIYRQNINVGMAVATGKGLMVPVIQNCEELNFLGICRKVNDLAIRTRTGRISADELQGSTFSITNYGIFDNLFGTPIINQPNTAILGVGTVKKRPVIWESDAGDAIVIRSMVYLSLGFDHRLIDGAAGGQFLKRLVDYFETMNTSMLL